MIAIVFVNRGVRNFSRVIKLGLSLKLADGIGWRIELLIEEIILGKSFFSYLYIRMLCSDEFEENMPALWIHIEGFMRRSNRPIS